MPLQTLAKFVAKSTTKSQTFRRQFQRFGATRKGYSFRRILMGSGSKKSGGLRGGLHENFDEILGGL